MGASQSKDELLYQQISYGNIEGIRVLRGQGAGLEWVDKEGKTPLIVASSRHDLVAVVNALIELGANVNAYRPGCHAGTALHHAAKKGCEQPVHLLLSNGEPNFSFSGWLREAYGPGFLEAFAPQLLIHKIWAVVLPCDHRNPTNPVKFELVIYSDLQTARPRSVVRLWKAQIEETKSNQVDPAIVIVDKPTRTRYKLFAANEGDKQQLLWFLRACRGISQVPTSLSEMQIGASMPNPQQTISNVSTQTEAAAIRTQEDIAMEMAINASIQMPPVPSNPQTTDTNGRGTSSENTGYNGSAPQIVDSTTKMNNRMPINEPNATAVPVVQLSALPSPIQKLEPPVIQPSHEAPSTTLAPSAPPISEDTLFDGPIHYPSIDSSPIDMSMTTTEIVLGNAESEDVGASYKTESSGEKAGSSSTSGCCVICLDAPVEGACIPCGHMAGCMSCLKDIESKQWGCPICRAKIDQVIRLYAV